MIQKCQNDSCGKEFKIIEQEKEFYTKVDLSLPVFCPDCRQERRKFFKNSRDLNKRKCSKCGEEIITTYSEDFESPVFCSTCFEENLG